MRSRPFPFNQLKRLYDWVLSFAESPYGTWALFLIAFSESSFFPIPPDVLLIALCIGAPRRSFFFALVTTLGSLIGAAFGYLLGWQFYQLLGRPILEFYGAIERYQEVGTLYQNYDALAVAVAGFTPIPFKVFTIAAGAFELDFWVFLAVAAASRGLRFFLVGGLIRFFGPAVKEFIERYFNLLTVLFAVLLIAGFLVLSVF